MNSLRTRLIAGFALAAILPLAIALVVLGQQVRSRVQRQASERLNGTLTLLASQFRSDAEALGERLKVLARDATLRRLYSIEPSGPALRQALAEERFLLGLDFLGVTDTNGTVIADAAWSAAAPAGLAREPIGLRALPRADEAALGATALEGALALEARAPILFEGTRVGMVRGGLALDAAALLRLVHTSGIGLMLVDGAGKLRASSLLADAPAPPPAGAAVRVRIGGRSHLAQSVPLAIGALPHARLVGVVSTAEADDALAALSLAALLLALTGTLAALLLGAVWSLQVSRPVERLAAYSKRIARGDWDEAPDPESLREMQVLVEALERMRGDLHAYRDRLRASERQAAYGQMARKVAHEIKNPLTPIAISIADLKRSHDLKRPDFAQVLDEAVRTVGEEVQTLQALIREFSEFGRLPAPRMEPSDLTELVRDLGVLYRADAEAGRLAVDVPGGPVRVQADRAQLRQALINLLKNGLEASGPDGCVTLRLQRAGSSATLEVTDTGPGLSAEQRAQLFVPGFTTKREGSGLGLTIVERIVSDHGGTLAVRSAPGEGATFRITLPLEGSA